MSELNDSAPSSTRWYGPEAETHVEANVPIWARRDVVEGDKDICL
jgi:hypothetical protein